MGNFLQGIGDTHLGRVFKNDVSLDRRGEYEKVQFEELEKLLGFEQSNLTADNFIKCQVGDWFDKPSVNLKAVFDSIALLEQYSKTTPDIDLVVISGNHDDAKNTSDVTAWDLLACNIRNNKNNVQNNIKFVKDSYVKTFANGEEILFIGWNITNSACEALLAALGAGYKNISTVVCHLDKISYGNEDNVIPYEFFAQHGIKMVISGHEHKPYHFYDQGMEIIGTGSLLPYSHAEDDGEEIYVTFKSIDEFENYRQAVDVTNKHIRLILDVADQERVLELANVNCYSLKIVKSDVAIELLDGETINEVVIEAYNAKAVWTSSVAETELDPEIGNRVWAEIELKGADE